MELSMVSEEYVVPSSPTPHHLKTHLLSFLDQAFPPDFVHIIFFYPVGVDNKSTCEINVDDIFKTRLGSLKQSLSKTLSSFYPLAGRLKDEISIDCNDEGVYFLEANAKSTLSEVLQRSECFHKLVPGREETPCSQTNNIAMVQVTSFLCGGMAISVSISHKIADAASLKFFLGSWAATTSDDGESCASQIAVPDFDGGIRFPKTDATPDPIVMLPPFLFKTGRSVTKRFSFDAEAIAALKEKSCSPRSKKKPTRVEAVSALLSKSIAAAMKARSGTARPIYARHIVNIRPRAMPPFPESCMGNYVCVAPASLGIVDENTELSELVIKLREAITDKLQTDFVKCGQSEPAKFFEILKDVDEVLTDSTVPGSNNLQAEPEHIGFNSWCNIGFNDIDFGWGKPLWIATTQSIANFGHRYMNSVFFMDTTSRDEVDAWITLDEEDMALLEQEKEFMTFAASNPNLMT